MLSEVVFNNKISIVFQNGVRNSSSKPLRTGNSHIRIKWLLEGLKENLKLH
jgi:hypothetical protein